jgi:phage tail sheath protein FI
MGVNVLRSLPGSGTVIWGARTLAGADANASGWKYVNVRRLALFVEDSIDQGTQWARFEPNDEPLWPAEFVVLRIQQRTLTP